MSNFGNRKTALKQVPPTDIFYQEVLTLRRRLDQILKDYETAVAGDEADAAPPPVVEFTDPRKWRSKN